MRKNKFVQKRQQSIKNIIILFILIVGLGYALLQQNLDITGIASLSNPTWNIHWENVQVAEGSVTGDNVVTAPTIDSDLTTVNYSVILNTPGDYYEFTVDAVNSGSINGIIENVDSKLNGATITTLPDYLDYTITYSDGTNIQKNQLLNAGTSKTYKLKIKYRDDIELNQIPATNQILNLKFTVKYKQADNGNQAETNITYNANGGTGTMENQTIPANSTENLTKNTFTREGYNFKNWNTKSDGTGTTYNDEEEVSNLGEITLFAQWKVEPFPYVFRQDGTCTFNGSSANITGEDCSKYTNGKYIDTGIKLYSETNKSKDYEIGFTIEEYVPSSNVDQATLMNTKYESTGYPGVVFRKQDNTQFELASRKTSSANENYRFASAGVRDVKIWRINNEIYYKIDDGPKTFLNNLSQYNPTFDLNVWFGATPTNASATTAQRYFTGKLSNMYIRLGTYVDNSSYTITFNPNGGEVDPEFITVSEGDAVGTLPTPTKALHNFVGWYTGLTDGVEVTSTYVPSDDIEIFARWQKKPVYTISFDTDGGSSVDDIEIEQGTAIGTLPVPTKANMSFDGWYLESTYNTKVASSYIPTESITLHAKWSDSTFPKVFEQIGACTFNGSSGTITGENCGDYVGQKYIDTGIALYSETNKNKDYEIGFTINSYTPTDNESRATLMNTKLEATGYPGVVFRRNDATDNFVLQSRKTSSANEQKTFAYNTVTSVKVYRISNEIYYSINGGDKVLLNNLTEYNPTFNLTTWFGAAPSNEAGTAAQRYLKGTLSNMYIKLGEYQEEGKYRITYNVNGGEEISPNYLDINQGDPIGWFPTLADREWYIFDGWYTDLTGGIEVDENYIPTGNMEVYARWSEIPSYTIIFNSNGGSSVPDRRIVQGANIGTLPSTTKSMADFEGWYTGLTDGIEIDENYIPTEDIEIFARWNEMAHTLYNVMKDEARKGTYATEYNGNHQDSMAGIGSEKIYHWYAPATTAGNSLATGILNKNNVIFANKCWQTIRTTDTGGVKMIYNGLPNDGKCTSTGSNQTIGSSSISSDNDSLNDVGYMYNTTYSTSFVDKDKNENIHKADGISYTEKFYISENIVWNSEDNKWELENSIYSTYNENGGFKGYYMEYNDEIIFVTDSVMTEAMDTYPHTGVAGIIIYVPMNTYYNNYIYGDSYTDNGNGTYTINNPTVVNKTDLGYSTSVYDLQDKYICENSAGNTCNEVRYVQDVISDMTGGNYSYSYTYRLRYYSVLDGVIFSSDVAYDTSSNLYHLTGDSVVIWNYSDYDTLNSHHYTCMSAESAECSTVTYLTQITRGYRVYYVNIDDGKKIGDVINEMLYSNDVNTNDSNIKTYIENWYRDNMNDYTNKLEDSIFCFDRTIREKNGWDPSGNITRGIYFEYNKKDLMCVNITDRFSVSNNVAKLNYPVGLMTKPEIELLGNSNIYKTGKNYWIYAPAYFSLSSSEFYHVTSLGELITNTVYNSYNVRPVISLKPNTEFIDGDGSKDNPYVVE